MRYIKRIIFLSWFTIIYNLIEGFISIGFGISDEAISLAGFGGDSLIEVGSAFLILWRFRDVQNQEATLSIERERRATFGIGVLFIILASITIVASILQLVLKSHPETTVPGIIISLLSLSFMFYLWSAKKQVAKQLNSSAVMKDADCSLACIKLSIVLFCGSLLFLSFPFLWWVDSLAALVLSFIIGRDGISALRATRREDFAGGCGCV